MDLVLTISQTLGRALVFAISFDPRSESSFITPILQMRKWRLRGKALYTQTLNALIGI